LEDIFIYLKKSSNRDITFREGNCKLVEYSDFNWVDNYNDHRSISKYIFLFNNRPINWNSKKQKCVALSSAEAEYVALAIAGQKAIYLKQMINIFLPEKLIHSSITIIEDNQSVIKITHNSEDRKKIRYINIRYHFIRQLVNKKNLNFNKFNLLINSQMH
jgi:hypothetical protein